MSDGATLSLRDVVEWGWGEAKHLAPTQTLVLQYLIANAFLSPDNPEQAPVGQVLRGRSRMVALRKHTGLSDNTARAALRGLQERAYIVTDMKRGRGQSRIMVLWDDHHAELRDDLRAGVRDLPAYLRVPSTTAKKTESQTEDATILQFPVTATAEGLNRND